LVRHRISSFSHQSQRYVNALDFNYITPPSISSTPEALALYINFMDYCATTYEEIRKALLKQGKSINVANEDARYVLPNAVETKIIVTMNCRSLLNFLSLRCCNRAQWEIRDMANAMLKICRKELPVIFNTAGANCEIMGCCPEGKLSCGKYLRCDELN